RSLTPPLAVSRSLPTSVRTAPPRTSRPPFPRNYARGAPPARRYTIRSLPNECPSPEVPSYGLLLRTTELHPLPRRRRLPRRLRPRAPAAPRGLPGRQAARQILRRRRGRLDRRRPHP